jgi:hypothetical protein
LSRQSFADLDHFQCLRAHATSLTVSNQVARDVVAFRFLDLRSKGPLSPSSPATPRSLLTLLSLVRSRVAFRNPLSAFRIPNLQPLLLFISTASEIPTLSSVGGGCLKLGKRDGKEIVREDFYSIRSFDFNKTFAQSRSYLSLKHSWAIAYLLSKS